MKKRSVVCMLMIAALAPVSYAAGNEKNSIQVTVKDVRGKPAVGARLWLEKRNSKESPKNAVTDAHGQWTFENVAAGAYKVSAIDAKQSAGAAAIANPAGGHVSSVTLSLAKMVGAAGGPAKKSKHYVWVAEETGTHIGGGRWVLVDDDVNGSGSSTVEKRGGAMFTQPTSDQLRPFNGISN